MRVRRVSLNRNPKTILVRAPNWIGDQILAYPFFHFLRNAYPQAKITVVCVPWVEALQFKNLVDEVHVLPKNFGPKKNIFDKFIALEDLAQNLKTKGPWDLAITLPHSFSSAWIQFRAGAKERRGYDMDGRGLFLNSKIQSASLSLVHRSQAYLNLLPAEFQPKIHATDFWGVEAENELDDPTPGVVPEFDAQNAWPEADPVDAPQGTYWVVAPGSVAESRRWPVENFLALARIISAETGMPGFIVGGPSEVAIATTLCEDRSVKLKDLTAQGSAASYWKVFKNAHFTVSNDSGLAHVASLCGSPVQIVWGAGDPKRTEAIGPGKTRVLFNPIDCWPCEKNICLRVNGPKLECLKGINPELLWKEIKHGLKVL